jgi:enamine deaminase RidA (YjgF/YER057c/UK114 family)
MPGIRPCLRTKCSSRNALGVGVSSPRPDGRRLHPVPRINRAKPIALPCSKAELGAWTCTATRRIKRGEGLPLGDASPMIEFLMVPDAPKPVAPFSHATAADGWLFVTGQMPTDPDDDSAPLPVGIEAQTRRVIDNLKLVLAGIGSGLDRVVFARVYLARLSDAFRARLRGDERGLSILFRARASAGADLHRRHRSGARRAGRDRPAGAPTSSGSRRFASPTACPTAIAPC